MSKCRFALAACCFLIGCADVAPQVSVPKDTKHSVRAKNPARAVHDVGTSAGRDGTQAIIRTGDSLATTIATLLQHQIKVHEIHADIAWDDGKDRRLYSVSRSRNPDDLLVVVALHNKDGSDSEIEMMYWEVDFVKQNVPKGLRPDAIHESAESVSISELVSDSARR